MLALERAGLDWLQDNYIEACRRFDALQQKRNALVLQNQERFMCDLTS